MPAGLVTLAVGALGALGTVGGAWLAGSFRSKTTVRQSSLANTREDLRLTEKKLRIVKRQLVACLKDKADEDGATKDEIIQIVEMGLRTPEQND